MLFKKLILTSSLWKALAILALHFLVVSTLLLGKATAAPDNGYLLNWWTLDAGGGSSSGGSYQLSGGVSQPDAGSMSGGNYQMQGGFWQATTYYIHLPLVVR